MAQTTRCRTAHRGQADGIGRTAGDVATLLASLPFRAHDRDDVLEDSVGSVYFYTVEQQVSDLEDSNVKYNVISKVQAELNELQLKLNETENRSRCSNLSFLGEESQAVLLAPITLLEVKEAILVSPSGKACGEDGLPAEVYKTLIGQVAEFLVTFVNDMLNEVDDPASFTRAS
ncbi:hypothetical protein NDU88_004333 [Pleurodeles waltl]|uniref:Uncharacterized protein n=1 Tax=Pleurodeles waltl TaxID=8319 RepID=A0AAV7QC98_PLEWA|nr:hypothetical protein NDU88_004333 [Pleurodeles waltl]